MKKIILTLLFVTSLFGVELDWLHDYDKALSIAKKEHKDVYLLIGADKCRFCQKFKDITLSKKFVMDKLEQKFVPLYLSRDQHKIPDKFERFGAPRHYFLSSDGKILHEAAGLLEPAGFLSLIDEVDLMKD